MARPDNTGECTVLVDMDGVLADFEEPNNDIVRRCFPELVPITDREEFYFPDSYQMYPGVSEVIDYECRRPGFIRNFPLVDGALQGWRRIMDAGFTPRVCSSPLPQHETVIDEKLDWLQEYFVPVFGSWVVDTAIFNRDKSGYDAIALIDDRPTVHNADRASWQHIMYDRSYNRLVNSNFRLHTWFDPNLEALLDRAARAYFAR